MLKHFGTSLLFTGGCLAAAFWLGIATTGTWAGAFSALWIVTVLGVLEVSLSFDNAIVNASVLAEMAPVWRRRFLTWGMLISVVGMRIVFPLAIVAVAAHLGPIEALRLAANNSAEYARIVKEAHVGISGFGGAFLGMVGLTFFLDGEKDIHWIGAVEKPLARLARLSGLAVGLVLLALCAMSRLLPLSDAFAFLTAGILGLVAYVAVDGVGSVIGGQGRASAVGRSGLGSFLYLEMLDASFSFDGVLGALALSNNLVIIALGLGIGAMFVRSMTGLIVHRGVLTEFQFLDHGAFYAITSLAGIMLLSSRFEIPEILTGFIGAGLIVAAFLDSLRHKRARGGREEIGN